MTTPTHFLISFALLKSKIRTSSDGWWIALGAFIPDAVIFFLFFYALITSIPQSVLWNEIYFLDTWQNAIDCFNSVPLTVVLIGVATLLKWRGGILLGASMLIHFVFDFFSHHDDAHRHFFPLSNYRFESPISYWDPAHYGAIGSGIEIIIGLASATYLWRTVQSTIAKVLLILYATILILTSVIAPLLFG